MANTVLTLYGRRDCHLCDEMRVALERWRSRLRFEVESIDIDGNLTLIGRFGDKVPVLMHKDQEVCHHVLDEAALLECLERT